MEYTLNTATSDGRLSVSDSEEQTFACFVVDGCERFVPLDVIENFPNSLLARICKECPDCLHGNSVVVNTRLTLFDWIIDVYKGKQFEIPLPSIPIKAIEESLNFFQLPSPLELQLYRNAEWHRKRRTDTIRTLTHEILELLSLNSSLKSSFEFLLYWNQDKIWTDCINVELLWKHIEPQYYSEESAILNILFKTGFVRPWTCTKIFVSDEHLYMENKPKNWSMGFPILTESTLEQFNKELRSFGFAMTPDFSEVTIGSDSFTKDVRIPFVRISY